MNKKIVVWIGLVFNALNVLSVVITYIAAPESAKPTIIKVGVLFVAVVCAGTYLLVSRWVLREEGEPHGGLAEPSKEKHVWFFSSGICVSVNRSAGTIIVNLQILSTERTELVYLWIELRNAQGTSITCVNSEPMIIERLIATAKIIEQKIAPKELEWLTLGSLINLGGYAKFRDWEKIGRQEIAMTTIPSL